MDIVEARALLSLYRPGVDDSTDGRFARALELAKQDEELSRWVAQEQTLDAALAEKLHATPVPPDLKANLLALSNVIAPEADRWHRTWRPALAGAAIAAVLTLAAALLFLRSMSPPNPGPGRRAGASPALEAKPATGSLDDFRAEMISFVQLRPPLEYESPDPAKLKEFLRRSNTPADMRVPAGLLQLPGMGCRTLVFRGYKVALMCFLRKDGQLVHLIVMDRKALPEFRGTRAHPVMQPDGAWMTAAWVEGGLDYLVAVKGGRPLLDSYLALAADRRALHTFIADRSDR